MTTLASIAGAQESGIIPDTLSRSDTLPLPPLNIPISADTFDAVIDYGSDDSSWYDVEGQLIYLIGNAYVHYLTISLTADYIVVDVENDQVFAKGLPDSTGQIAGKPEFKDGEESFKADSIRFNFKTNKGIVYDLRTQYNDVHVLGVKTKVIRETRQVSRDSTAEEDVVYNRDALFTTCDHPEPHFGVRSRKQKLIPNKLVIVGPSTLEIMGVQTLWMPFAFFPIKQGQRTGLIFPRDYEFSPTWGFGLRNIGYYFPLGEYFDLQVTGDIYTRGSWGLNVTSNYRKRYKFNGNFAVSYSNRQEEGFDGSPIINKSYSVRWSHNQDPKAHPYRRISGNVNIQTNDYRTLNYNDASSVLTNTMRSSITFSQIFPDKPFTLSANLQHSQNTTTKVVTMSLPNLNFNLSRIYPFKKKNRIGPEKWFEKISFRYDAQLQNQISTFDSLLFTRQAFDDAKYGVRHNASADVNLKIFRYVTFTPNIRYKENWYFRHIEKSFDRTPTVRVDTIYNADSSSFQIIEDTLKYGSVLVDTVSEFTPVREFSVGVSVGTTIFGTLRFKGKLRGIRHVMRPNIGFSYTPDYTRPELGYYREVQTDSRSGLENFQQYSIFDGGFGFFGIPSRSGKQMSLNYSITNNFEAKYFSKKDSTEKILKIFDNVNVGGSYNFSADSLKFSMIGVNGTTRLLKSMTTVSISALFDPYAVNDLGRRINTFQYDVDGKLFRFVNASIAVNTSMSLSQIKDLLSGKQSQTGETSGPLQDEEGGDSFVDMFSSFFINHTLGMAARGKGSGFKVETNSIYASGNIQLTKNWGIRIGNIGYDFDSRSVTYPDIGFTRTLHCWEMGMNWQPVRGTYAFYLRVRPGSLDFIELPYKKNNVDANPNILF